MEMVITIIDFQRWIIWIPGATKYFFLFINHNLQLLSIFLFVFYLLRRKLGYSFTLHTSYLYTYSQRSRPESHSRVVDPRDRYSHRRPRTVSRRMRFRINPSIRKYAIVDICTRYFCVEP